jgi:cbb3-type cytochrome oxidase maturation protein
MDILYLLIPMSAVLVLLILGVFGWALHRGQFDDVEREGERILQDDGWQFDRDQGRPQGLPEQSKQSSTDQS